MPKIKYRAINFQADTLGIINKASEIISEYLAQGFTLTLRQLYYQFVSRDLIRNTEREYKRLGSIISDGRLAGLIDWKAIEDRTRELRSLPHWDTPAEIVTACSEQFSLDKWKDQKLYCEVWIEKDALIGVIQGVCREFDLPHFSCRGYTSQSEMWEAGQRLLVQIEQRKKVLIFHLGDHDPSGLDMTRDIEDRLQLFTGGRVKLSRLALNMPQVEQYKPPPNPAKVTDARFAAYQSDYGNESWELDALEPAVIVALIRKAVMTKFNRVAWSATLVREGRMRQLLVDAAARLGDEEEFLPEFKA